MDVRTSLAVLMPGGDIKSIPFFLVNTLTDVFLVWQTIIMIFGVAVIYNFAKQRAAMVVLIPTFAIVAIVSIFKLVF